jgi:chromosome segregation ATPase
VDRLFDDIISEKEGGSLDRLKELDTKIANAINKVKTLKDENSALKQQVEELQGRLIEKDEEIRGLSEDNLSIKDQINDLLNELDTIETE